MILFKPIYFQMTALAEAGEPNFYFLNTFLFNEIKVPEFCTRTPSSLYKAIAKKLELKSSWYWFSLEAYLVIEENRDFITLSETANCSFLWCLNSIFFLAFIPQSASYLLSQMPSQPVNAIRGLKVPKCYALQYSVLQNLSSSEDRGPVSNHLH